MLRKVLAVAVLATAAALSSSPIATAAVGDASGSTTRERGYAISCTGEASSMSAFVLLYKNSSVTVPTEVVIEQRDAVLVASKQSPSPRIRGGRVRAVVPLVDRDTRVEAGTAWVRGTYTRVGPVTRVHEVFDDAGEHIVTTGTNQDLRTRLRVTVGSTTIPLTCDEAFAFNLKVKRTPIS